MQQRFVFWLAASALFVPLILSNDGPGAVRQLTLAVGTAGFLLLLLRASRVEVSLVLIAILVATIGECVLSLGWGLYRYHYALLPFYVPVGHGLFFTLAAWSSRQPAMQRREQQIYRWVLLGGSAAAVGSFLLANDQWGLLWWLLAATLLMRSRNRLLLSLCFVYTYALEWLGTSLGNWRWMPLVPGLGLRCANPPSGVGVLYVVLDLITVSIWTSLFALRPAATTRSVLPCDIHQLPAREVCGGGESVSNAG